MKKVHKICPALEDLKVTPQQYKSVEAP